MMLPNEAFARIAKQENIVKYGMTNNGFWCNNHQFLKSVDLPTECVKLARSASDAATQVQRVRNNQFKIECPRGSAAYDLRRNTNTNTYTMKCNSLPALGVCETVKYVAWRVSIQNWDIFHDTVHAAGFTACPAMHVLVGLKSEFSPNVRPPYGKVNFEIKCCLYTSFSGIKVSSDELLGFQKYEGMYCPTKYDDLLRPQFRQINPFGPPHRTSSHEHESYINLEDSFVETEAQ
eukprot:479586-Amorphochlora_amoeboformis.AAC.1